MSPIAIAILSVSMSADAFAAAIGRGAQHRPTLPQALRSGLVFGVIEAITPLIGFALGVAAAAFVQAIDHWIAFGLLGAVGGKMIWEALKRDEEAEGEDAPSGGKAASRGLVALVATAVGTSIDAGAVGVGLALLDANIWLIAACIGATTFALATLGLLIGKAVGSRLGKIVELVGGVALIALGLKILLEHLGFLAV
ncbi:manganese efflux pump [Brevundimonas naejangsanensis]|uniref:Putative manganese efflux pump MntP n=1 Tax=Brevundimonas naejangsanensis TaxID=588932 RepID=A0A494RIZ0_9CAUL|nr:manganese efflux pump MntP family protein [Brevundimonas naejangsanensis]AYG94440.1 manganese efflux pump [Brevundimonas naejangsanensis]